MKIPFFEQDLKEFLSHKTNWTGMTLVLIGIVGIFNGMDSALVVSSIMGGLSLLFVRDAIAKK